LLCAGLTALLVGCAGTPEAADIDALLAERGYTTGEEVRDIKQYRINGWQSLDDRHVIIETGPASRYLLTLMTRCDNLRTAETIGFSTTTGNLTTFDKLVVRGTSGIVRDCPITTIQELHRTEK
jgi:hypothetical protein